MSIQSDLQTLERKMHDEPSHIQSLAGVLQFDVTGDDKTAYQVVFANGTVTLRTEDFTAPLCTLKLSEENLAKLLRGELNATTAVFTGKLQVKGDIGFALKIQSVLQKYT